MSTEASTAASRYSVQYTRDCLYLAGIFDAGLPTQIVEVPMQYKEPKYKIRMSKTSTDSAVPLIIRQKLGVGSLFQTARGTRWSIESQKDIMAFLDMVEPYSLVRKEEIRILRRLLQPEEGDVPAPELVKEWNKLKTMNKVE